MTPLKRLVAALFLSALAAHAEGLAKRSPQAEKDLVDLTACYNSPLNQGRPGEPNLAAFPQGLQILAQAAFDARGIIQLSGKPGDGKFPRAVNDIGVGNRGTSLQFLHGTVGRVPDETKIGEYILHYVDGRTVRLPIIYQRQARDWLQQKGDPLPTDADLAWAGANAAAKDGAAIQLYCYTARNPFPEVEIASLDFQSAEAGSAPFLVAVSMATDKGGGGFRKPFRPVRIDNAILPRSADAGAELVDLSAFYNTSPDDDWINYPGHDFQDLPKGVQTFAGVKFDVRGMIVVASGHSLKSSRVLFPDAVPGIAVHRHARKLHFLQGCGYSDKAGMKLGEYVIHYADGQTLRVPMVYQRNVLDWWTRADDAPLPEAVEAWRGANPSSRGAGRGTHLFKYTWQNPRPEVEIASIDLVTSYAMSVPFLVALTFE